LCHTGKGVICFIFIFYIDVIVSHAVVYTHSLFKVVSYTTNPAAGEVIAFFCVVVIRGGRKPLVVDASVSIDDVTFVVVPTNKLPVLCRVM
jgi:hypothetical protein